MKLIERLFSTLCALPLVLALSACGGAGVASVALVVANGVGTGGTGIVFGTVTGFGSMIVDGTTYSSATPQYFAGTDQHEAAEASAASLGLGNQVQVQLDAQGNPTSVIIEPALVGAISQIDSNQFVVNGMTVRINRNATNGPTTYYSGLDGYSSLSVGMRVAVHGAYGVDAGNMQEYVQASLIEQLPSSSTVNRLSGLVTNLNTAAGTFQIGGTTVQFDAATSVLPAGTSLADGLWVNVWSSTAPGTNGELRAGAIRARTLAGVTGQVQLSGIVSRLTGTQFQVSGIAVDASASALASVVSKLAPGEYVVVQGQADASGSSLVASSIRTFAAQPVQVELNGTITGFVDQGNFLVRGVAVDASTAQLLGAASGGNLRNGIFVEVSGSVSGGNGNVVTATSVSAETQAPDGGTVNYQGTVSQYNAATGSFVLTGSLDDDATSVLVKLASNVAYTNGGAAQLADGANVEIEATKGSGEVSAYDVYFRKLGAMSGSMSGGKFESEGLAYDVSSSAFSLNGLTIQINGIVSEGGTLVNGAKVEVEFTRSGGQNLAQKIAIDD